MKLFFHLFIILSLIGLVSIANAQEPKQNFELSAPKDWRPETIPFPLDFAPEIKYKGFEELCFAPGMFKRDSATYFTYVFFWYLEGDQTITAKNLEQNLTLYFRGLCKEVGEAKKLTIDTNQIKAKVTKHNTSDLFLDSKYNEHFDAQITIFDSFNKGEKVELNSDIAVSKTQKNTVLFFCVSPKPYNDSSKIWFQMYDIRNSLKIK